jgi:hypothetical protein
MWKSAIQTLYASEKYEQINIDVYVRQTLVTLQTYSRHWHNSITCRKLPVWILHDLICVLTSKLESHLMQ